MRDFPPPTSSFAAYPPTQGYLDVSASCKSAFVVSALSALIANGHRTLVFSQVGFVTHTTPWIGLICPRCVSRRRRF